MQFSEKRDIGGKIPYLITVGYMKLNLSFVKFKMGETRSQSHIADGQTS